MILTAGEISLLRAEHPNTLLAMKATVERNTPTTTNTHGHPVEAWATHLTDEPCWYDPTATQSNNKPIEGPNVNYTPALRRLVFAAGTDIVSSDRITSVTGADGEQIAGQMTIHETRTYVASVVVYAMEVE